MTRTISDPLVYSSTLRVVGAVDFDSNLNVDGTLNVEGASVIDDTLNVTGATDLDSTLNVDGASTFNAAVTVKPGTASDTAKVGGMMSVNSAGGANVGSGEDPLATFTVPANTLAVNNQSLWFEVWGTFASNANAKRVRVHFGSSGTTQVMDSNPATSINNSTWVIRGRIVRTGAATQKGFASMIVNPVGAGGGSNMVNLTTALNQTLSGAIDLRVTGEAVSDNDIVCHALFVGWDGENS